MIGHFFWHFILWPSLWSLIVHVIFMWFVDFVFVSDFMIGFYDNWFFRGFSVCVILGDRTILYFGMDLISVAFYFMTFYFGVLVRVHRTCQRLHINNVSILAKESRSIRRMLMKYKCWDRERMETLLISPTHHPIFCKVEFRSCVHV